MPCTRCAGFGSPSSCLSDLPMCELSPSARSPESRSTSSRTRAQRTCWRRGSCRQPRPAPSASKSERRRRHDAALGLEAIAPTSVRIPPRRREQKGFRVVGVPPEADGELVPAGVSDHGLASDSVSWNGDRLHTSRGPLAAAATRPDVHALKLASKLSLGRVLPAGRCRRRGTHRLEGELGAVVAHGLTCWLVVHLDQVAIKAPWATSSRLVVPDASVQLHGGHRRRRVHRREPCRFQRVTCHGSLLLIDQGVDVALAALRADEVATTRLEASTTPSGLLVELDTLGHDLRSKQQALVWLQGEEPDVQGLPDAPAGAYEHVGGGAEKDRRDVAVELDVLVVEGRRVVGVEAEDVQPHEILRPAPAIRLAGPPVLRPPLQGRRNGPSHRRHFHLVPVDQVPVARTQLLDILRGHQHQDVGASAGLLGQRQGLDLQTVEEGQPWPSRPANVSVDEGVLAAPWGFRRTSVHIKAGGAPSFPVLAAPRATRSMVDLAVALSPQPHGLGSLRLCLLVVLLGHALPLDHLWRSLTLLHLLNNNRLFCSDDGRRRVHFTHFPDQSVAVVRMSVLCRRGAVSEVTLDHILHRRLLARQQRGAI
mmetsp:Transcript_27037/g.68388  ORF Transcript_27037/g.68388 Transcript_27037/m.68388 type:complete len:595 (-) Transcript_27037:133-1917(-)